MCGGTNCEVTLHIGHVTAWQCHIVTGHNPRYYERERRWLGNNHIWPSPSNSWVGRHLNLLKNKSLLNSFRWGEWGEEAKLQIMSGTRLGPGSEAIFRRWEEHNSAVWQSISPDCSDSVMVLAIWPLAGPTHAWCWHSGCGDTRLGPEIIMWCNVVTMDCDVWGPPVGNNTPAKAADWVTGMRTILTEISLHHTLGYLLPSLHLSSMKL